MSSEELSGVRILVVDDVVDNQDLFRIFLESAGAQIEIAVNGADALTKINGNYDVVLMDIQMPILDGLSATRKMRAQGVTIPIIALTAHALPEEALKSEKAGCTDHVLKPVSSKALVAAVRKAIGRS